jgi:hypothetical protein
LLRHRRYNRLCALAARGEVPAAEMKKFTQHVAGCARCQTAHSEFHAINAGLLPTDTYADGDEELIEALRKPTRNAILEAIAEIKPQQYVPEVAISPISRRSPWPLRVAFATMAMALISASFWVSIRYFSNAPVRLEIHAAAPPTVVLESTKLNGDRGSALSAEQQRNQQLQAEFDKQQRELALAERREIQMQQQIAAQARDLVSTQALLAEKTRQIKQLEDGHSSETAVEVALRVQVQDLTDKLNSQTESLTRERDFLARGREIRDIIGARNLHIIDVYDTDTRGHTKRPFARAFYTEGKSLVFYAYDLPTATGHENNTYVAWGQANGSRSSIKNLGILVNDDQGQRRWTLSFSDPNVLAEIDSVFITLEPNGDAGSPSSKRMLTAYLNDTANHP